MTVLVPDCHAYVCDELPELIQLWPSLTANVRASLVTLIRNASPKSRRHSRIQSDAGSNPPDPDAGTQAS